MPRSPSAMNSSPAGARPDARRRRPARRPSPAPPSPHASVGARARLAAAGHGGDRAARVDPAHADAGRGRRCTAIRPGRRPGPPGCRAARRRPRAAVAARLRRARAVADRPRRRRPAPTGAERAGPADGPVAQADVEAARRHVAGPRRRGGGHHRDRRAVRQRGGVEQASTSASGRRRARPPSTPWCGSRPARRGASRLGSRGPCMRPSGPAGPPSRAGGHVRPLPIGQGRRGERDRPVVLLREPSASGHCARRAGARLAAAVARSPRSTATRPSKLRAQRASHSRELRARQVRVRERGQPVSVASGEVARHALRVVELRPAHEVGVGEVEVRPSRRRCRPAPRRRSPRWSSCRRAVEGGGAVCAISVDVRAVEASRSCATTELKSVPSASARSNTAPVRCRRSGSFASLTSAPMKSALVRSVSDPGELRAFLSRAWW